MSSVYKLTGLPPLPPNRIRWLQVLRDHGRCHWAQLARRPGDGRSTSHLTWRPMEKAGLITATFEGEPMTWWFELTPKGARVLRMVTGA